MAANPYDPVTTTDSTPFTDERDLPLPPLRYNRSLGPSRFKTLCGKLRHHTKKIIIISAVLLVVILIIILIMFAASRDPERHPTGDEGNWESPDQGLVFYPVPEDKSIVISFTPYDFGNMIPGPIKKSLDNILESYNVVKQLDESIFVDCNNSYAPVNKTCRVSRNLFGSECTSEMNYGYHGGQPCVFIQLNLPDGVTIKPIKKGDPLWEDAQSVLKEKSNPSYVRLTCQGTTSLDTEILESVGNGLGPHGELVMYYPEDGIQAYIYRKRNSKLPFLKPGVMVHFTSLVSRKKVHITCTAWGQLYDNEEKIIDHKLLTTHFVLYVNHS